MNIKTLSKKSSLTVMIGLAMLVGVVGGSVLKIVGANAQTTTPEATTATQTQTKSNETSDPSKATHVGSNGVKEELLTGTTAEKITAAALKAVPGGKIQRVETEADGNGVYEAHMTKSDGTSVTVFFDSNFNLTSTQEGHGKMKTQ